MKANETRIGNLVEYDGRTFAIHIISHEFPELNTEEFGIGRKTMKDTLIIKSKTNTGDPGKQYVFFCTADGCEPVLMIKKYLLVKETDNIDFYFDNGFKCEKKYKNVILLIKWYAIKINSFEKIIAWYIGFKKFILEQHT